MKKAFRFWAAVLAALLLAPLCGAHFFASDGAAAPAAASLTASTYAELEQALAAPGEADIDVTADIQVTHHLQVNGTKTLRSTGGHLVWAVHFGEHMIIVTFGSSLTLRDITLDGGDAQAPMIAVEGSYGVPTSLTLAAGTLLRNGQVTSASLPGGGVFAYGPGARVSMQEGAAVQNCSSSGRGGGLAFIGGAAFSMSGGTIQGCTAAYYGGGVYLQDSSMEMTGGAVTGNKAGSGGGIALWAETAPSGADSFQQTSPGMLTLGGDAHVTANIAESQGVGADVGAGGGIYQAGGVVQLDGGGVLVSGNTAAAEGGGAYVTYYSSGEYPEGVFYLRQGAVQGNTALFWGGGISSREGKVFMTGGAVAQNRVLTKEERAAPAALAQGVPAAPYTASGTFYGGGGISSETAAGFGGSGSLSLTGGAIRDNEAASCYGGGVFCWGSSETALPLLLGGVSITGNSARYGGGVTNAGRASSQYDSVLVMSGGSIRGNRAVADGGGVYNAEMPYFSRPAVGKVQVQFLLTGGSILENTAGGLGGGVYNARGRTPALAGDNETSVGRMLFAMGGDALVCDNTAAAGGDDAWNDNGVFTLRLSYPPRGDVPFAGWFSDDPGHRYAPQDEPLPLSSDLLNMTRQTLSSLTGGFQESMAIAPYGLKAVWRATATPSPPPTGSPSPSPSAPPTCPPRPTPKPCITPAPCPTACPRPTATGAEARPAGPLTALAGLLGAAAGLLAWCRARRRGRR